jgi:hypothetical protein
MDKIIDIYSLQEPAYLVDICDVILDHFMHSSKDEAHKWYLVIEQVFLVYILRLADLLEKKMFLLIIGSSTTITVL